MNIRQIQSATSILKNTSVPASFWRSDPYTYDWYYNWLAYVRAVCKIAYFTRGKKKGTDSLLTAV